MAAAVIPWDAPDPSQEPAKPKGRFEAGMRRISSRLSVDISGTSGTGKYMDDKVLSIAEQVRRFENSKAVESGLEPTWVIDPRTSLWIGWWDLVTSLALVFTAIITPVEVGFMRVDGTNRWVDPLFLLNRVVDFVFILDMILQFFLMFPTTEGGAHHTAGASHWERDMPAIARHYVCGKWFLLDVFSIGVSALDVFGGGGGESNDVSSLKALRAVRVLRLLKLVRLARGSRIFKRWEMRLSINYGLLSIATICIMLLFVCHLFACVWGLQASFDPLGTWLGQKGYCVPWNPSLPCPAGHTCDIEEGWDCTDAGSQYVISLYWSIATVTSIGYGDIVATPLHTIEQFVCVSMMLSGSLLFAYLVGSFCGLASNLSPDTMRFRQDLTDLNRFLAANQIPDYLRFQLREYMHQSIFLRRAATGNRLLSELAPKLRNEVALTMNAKWLHKIDLINDECEDGVILELAFALTVQLFPPGDSCPIGAIYIVSSGAAIYAGRAKTAGDSWGEADALLTTDRLRFPVPANAISYLFAYLIDGETLRAVMSQNKYPEAAFRMRRRQVIWIIRRGIVRMAEEKVAERDTRNSKRRSLFVPRHLGNGNKFTGIIEAARAASRGGHLAAKYGHASPPMINHSSSNGNVKGSAEAEYEDRYQANGTASTTNGTWSTGSHATNKGAAAMIKGPAAPSPDREQRQAISRFQKRQISLNAIGFHEQKTSIQESIVPGGSSTPRMQARIAENLQLLQSELNDFKKHQKEEARAFRDMLGLLLKYEHKDMPPRGSSPQGQRRPPSPSAAEGSGSGDASAFGRLMSSGGFMSSSGFMKKSRRSSTRNEQDQERERSTDRRGSNSLEEKSCRFSC